MSGAVIIFILTVLIMILSILFFPKIKVGKIHLEGFWLFPLIGFTVLSIFGYVDFNGLKNALLENTSINPIKILVLFISMTVLSVFLDEQGFFAYLASATLKKSGKSQLKLFIYLYIIVSVLTVFTSNDIIILSFTPFICYFAKNAKINPVPFLVCEFVAGNTWSMALIIGNPTNIYISQSFGITFLDYVKVMALPTLLAGISSLLILYLLFRKTLKKEIEATSENEEVKIKDKALLIIGLIHLGLCTVALAVSSYVEIEMWLVSLIFALSLIVVSCVYYLIKKEKPKALKNTIKRTPFSLIPFILSMFAIIITLDRFNVTQKIASLLGGNEIFNYGITSYFACNVINNIPMSVLFTNVLFSTTLQNLGAVYATVIGSNLGALLTPIGALAGIMWSDIINRHDLKFSYASFLKMGIVSIPACLIALFMLAVLI